MCSPQVVKAVGLFGKLDNTGRHIFARQVGLKLPATPSQVDVAFKGAERRLTLAQLISEMEDDLEFA